MTVLKGPLHWQHDFIPLLQNRKSRSNSYFRLLKATANNSQTAESQPSLEKPMNQTSDWLITEMAHNNCYILSNPDVLCNVCF
jgi:hypothetical protein